MKLFDFGEDPDPDSRILFNFKVAIPGFFNGNLD